MSSSERAALPSLPLAGRSHLPPLVLVDDLGFAPLDDVGAQLLFRFVAAAYEHRSLGVASHWPF